MRILHATESMTAGVLTMLLELVGQQVAAGHQVTVVYCRRPETTETSAIRRALPGARLVEVAAYGARSVLPLARALREVQTRTRPEVVHLHSSWAGVGGRLSLRRGVRRRIVYSPHGWAFLRQDVPATRRWLFRAMEHILGIGTAGQILVSESERLAFSGLPHVRQVVLSNVVRFDTLPARHVQTGRLVVCVARICAQKAPAVFARVADGFAGVRFVWVGDGDATLRRELTASGHVEVTGWLPGDQTRDIVARSSAVLLPSLWEGMPMCLIEAQAIGVPVVATNVVGNKDVVIDGVTGFLVDSEEAMSERLARLLDDPGLGARLGDQARRSALRRFNAQGYAERADALYASLLG